MKKQTRQATNGRGNRDEVSWEFGIFLREREDSRERVVAVGEFLV